MKVFFSGVGAIFCLFLIACGVGLFMSPTLVIERSIEMEAHSDDIFPYLEDLEYYRTWSALNEKLGDTRLITGGADIGTGQTQAWQEGPKGFEFGSREILQSQPAEFVQILTNIAGQNTNTTYALFANEDETVTVLSKIELPQPGFPYIGRLRRFIVQPSLNAEMDEALARLKTQVEANL